MHCPMKKSEGSFWITATQFDPQISRMFVDICLTTMVVIDEDNPAAQGYRDNAAIESVADKFISEVLRRP